MNYAAEWNKAHQRRLMRASHVDPRVQEFATRLLAESGKPAGEMTVIEVGCGTALNVCWLVEQGVNAFGSDSSPAAIDRARLILEETKGGSPLRVWVDDMTAPKGLAANYYDAVIDVRCLENLDQAEFESALKSIVAALRPGGRFFTITANPLRDLSLTECGQVRMTTSIYDLEHAGLTTIRFRDEWREENGNRVDDYVIEAVKP